MTIRRVLAAWLLVAQVAQARSTVPAEANGWMVDRWGTADGLPLDHITGLARDEDGLLWASTLDGIVKFDGRLFVVERRAVYPELPSNRFSRVVRDPTGVMWVVTETGAAAYRKDFRWEPATLPASMESASPSQHSGQVIRHQGGVWLAQHGRMLWAAGPASVWAETGLGAAALDGVPAPDGGWWFVTSDARLVQTTTNGRLTVVVGAPGRVVSSLARDGEGVVLATDDGHLWRAASDGWREIRLAGERVCRLYDGPNGILVVTSDGWWRVRGVEAEAWSAGPVCGEQDAPLVHAADGAVWAADRTGLYRDGQRIQAWEDEPSALEGDGAGGVWVATQGGGLLRARPARVRVLVPQTETNVQGLWVRPDGEVWLAPVRDAHVILRVREGREEEIVLPDNGTLTPRVNALAEDTQGHMWLGVGGGRLCRWDGQRCELIAAVEGPVAPRSTDHLFVAPDGHFWLSNELSVWRSAPTGPTGGWQEVLREGEPLRGVRTFAAAPDGAVYLGTRGAGLLRWSGGSVDQLGPQQDFVAYATRGMLVDGDGTVWVTTEDAGLCRLRPISGQPLARAAWRCMGIAEGMFDDSLHTVIDDGGGRLWFSSNRGIFYARRADLEALAEGRVRSVLTLGLDEAEGMISREANGGTQATAARDAMGRLWYPTQHGVVIVEPASLPVPEPPRVLLDRVEVDGKLVRPAKVLTLPAGTGELSLRWLAPQFDFAAQVGFQYRLRGADAAWRGVTSVRRGVWTHLPPGRLVVEVRSGIAGAWSEPYELLVIERIPAWYETWRREAVLGGSALLMIMAGALLSNAWQRRRRAWLESEVARRTSQLMEANRRLDRQNVELVQQADRLSASNRQVEEQAVRLAELDAARSRLVTNLSHELRTPLSLVLSPLEDLRAGLGGRQLKTLELMRRNGERVRELVDQLFDIALLDADHLPLRAKRVDVRRFMMEIVERFHALTEPRQQRLTAVLPEEVITGWFDPDMVEKVLTNLLGNACRFTPDGGEVRVVVTLVDGSIDRRVRVVVSDSGPGIPLAQQARVFERFYQIDGGDTRQHGGAGVGLALARELVELHGGQIGVTSQVGAGSSFWFELPIGVEHLVLEDVGAQPAVAVPAASEVVGEGPLVLVVEDHAELRSYLAEHLRDSFRVAEAVDGVDGLLRARELRPDVVVADVMMPRMDGITMCRQLRADPALQATPVLLVSAKAAPSDEAVGREVANDYMTKPFVMRELVARVSQLAPQHAELSPPGVELGEADQRLLARLDAAIDERLVGGEFDYDQLARSMAMSRRTLQREVRRLTGRSPSEHVQARRMDTARGLLDRGVHGTVSEVAAAVGLSRQHFVRLYAAWFGHPPSEDLRG